MGRKYRVISADGHVETPPDPWVKYVPEQVAGPRAAPRQRCPRAGEGWLDRGPAAAPQRPEHHRPAARSASSTASYFKPDGSPNDGAGDAAQRLREQDEDGIDAEVLFPPVFASRFLEGINDREVYCSMVRAYNTWLAEDYCSVAPDRLIGNSRDADQRRRRRGRGAAVAHDAGLRVGRVLPCSRTAPGSPSPRTTRSGQTCARARHGDLAALRVRRDPRRRIAKRGAGHGRAGVRVGAHAARRARTRRCTAWPS